MQHDDHQILDAPTCVRRYTGSTAMTAALLILFGYFMFGSDLISAEDTSTVFIIAWQVFVHTLRLGGLLMAALAVCISIGFPMALLADAIVTAAIGALLVVSCVLFLASDGLGLDYIICGLCGFSLLASGFRCWRDYDALPAETWVESIEDVDLYGYNDDDNNDGVEAEETLPMPRSQGSQSQTQQNDQPNNEPVHFDKPKSHKHRTKSSRFEPDEAIDLDSLTLDDTPPDGFLADFGKKK